MTLDEAFAKFGNRCPSCHSNRLSSDNSVVLNHRCLDCGKTCTEPEALKPPITGWPDWEMRIKK